MPTPFASQQIKHRTALLVFIKGSSAPLVLYVDNPQETYNELHSLLQNNVTKVVEKTTNGPIKKVCFLTSQISAIALQEEQFV